LCLVKSPKLVRNQEKLTLHTGNYYEQVYQNVIHFGSNAPDGLSGFLTPTKITEAQKETQF